jgi:hypothetical protein
MPPSPYQPNTIRPLGTYTVGDATDRAYKASEARQAQQRADDKRYRKKWFNVIRAASLGIAGGAGAAGMLAGGAAAGGAAASSATLPAAATAGMMAPSVAPVATGAGMSIPWWSVASQGVNTLSSIYANRKNAQANQQAMSVQERANAEAMAFEREQMAEQRRQFDIQQAAAKEALAAQNKFEADKWAASEEERLYDRRLRDERETRRAPYRQASADALGRIPGLLASGRTSPGLASLGSYRRG